MSASNISLDSPASAVKVKLPTSVNGFSSITIRPLALVDAPKILAGVEESLSELKRFIAWSYFPQTIESQKSRIISVIHSYWTMKDFAFNVVDSDSDAFIGASGLHARTLHSKGLEIGYWIRSSLAGNGLATVITKALIVYGFDYLKLNRIQCCYNTLNTRSARVAEKCGFKVEGILKNFEPLPTQEMILSGWQSSSEMIISALYPESIDHLDWYEDFQKRITVYDWLSQKV